MLDSHGKRNITQAQLSYMLEDIYYDYRIKTTHYKDDVSRVENMVKKRGLNTHVVQGEEMTVIGCIGDTAKVDSKLFEIDSAVDKVMHVQEPYKLANRAFHPEDSIIDVSGVKLAATTWQ